jgi:hypothetical protein
MVVERADMQSTVDDLLIGVSRLGCDEGFATDS